MRGWTTMRNQTLHLQKIQRPMDMLELTTMRSRTLARQKIQMPMGKLESTQMRSRRLVQLRSQMGTLPAEIRKDKPGRSSLGMARSE